jgi:ABC-2 type transport system permease protein
MLLLTPVIMVLIGGGFFMKGNLGAVPDPVRPLIAFAAMAMMLFTLIQLVGNQFGFDRSGFKIYVLSPAPRREILLGKNLAVAPMIFILTTPLIAAVQVFVPMGFDYLAALPFQFVSMFCLFCALANVLSILAPMPVAAGSLKAVNPKVLPVLLHMLLVFSLPVTMAPTLVPWGIAAGLDALGWAEGIPVCSVLTVLECMAIVALYRLTVTWQGRLLQHREQQILDIVTTRAE